MKHMKKYLIVFIVVVAAMLLSSCRLSELKFAFWEQDETMEVSETVATVENSDSTESTEEEPTEEEETVDTSDVHIGKDADYEWGEYQPFS